MLAGRPEHRPGGLEVSLCLPLHPPPPTHHPLSGMSELAGDVGCPPLPPLPPPPLPIPCLECQSWTREMSELARDVGCLHLPPLPPTTPLSPYPLSEMSDLARRCRMSPSASPPPPSPHHSYHLSRMSELLLDSNFLFFLNLLSCSSA